MPAAATVDIDDPAVFMRNGLGEGCTGAGGVAEIDAEAIDNRARIRSRGYVAAARW